jgi:hypothetical protein
MGRPEEPLDRDGSPVREFAFWLRDLRNRSGLTYDQMGRKAHFATSTVQAATAGRRRPTLRVTLAFVDACGGDEQQWRAYWTQVRRLLDQQVPAGILRTVTPPWAEIAPPPTEQQAASISPALSATDGWFIESFSALLRLDADPVEAWERRRIVATVDGLDKLVTSVSVPRHPDDPGQDHGLESDLLYGGSIEACQQPYDSYFQNTIVLPRTLRSGERHEYAIRLRIPPGQRVTSHYVHVPYRRSDRFELRVRFDPRRLPEAGWLVRAAPTAVIYQRKQTSDRLTRIGSARFTPASARCGRAWGTASAGVKSTRSRPVPDQPGGHGACFTGRMEPHMI